MMISKKIIQLTLIIFSFTACRQDRISVLSLGAEKDLIPEGIAVSGDKIFISSIYKNKIVVSDGTTTRNFIESNQYGFRSGVGLLAKDDLLFALTNDTDTLKTYSALFVFQISTGKLLHSFELQDQQKHFFNDLAVTANHEVYITDTRQYKIWKLNYPQPDWLEWMSINEPNGIALSADDQKLFVATWDNGIQIIDMAKKKVLNGASPETRGVDGLKYVQGTLFAIKNASRDRSKHGLYEIRLSYHESGFTQIDTVILAHPHMNVPTTFDYQQGCFYVLANSQLLNLDQDTNTIIDVSKLTDTYVLKLKHKAP